MVRDTSNDDIFNIEEEDGDEPPSPQLHMYPLAFLGHYGQLQSNSILPAFKSIIQNIVGQISEVEELATSHRTIHTLKGVFLQMYQSSFHRAAPYAGGGEIDHGWITAAAAGTLNSDPRQSNHISSNQH